jgi:pyridinium-3,5-bisthiocarboxylic acid mononucleotide nickel chelatase
MKGGFETDEVFRLETNLDDCTAELLGVVMERLFGAGALDVWFTPIQMKKNRPAVMLSALCEEAVRDALAEIILNETTAFGIRIDRVRRLKLARRMTTVATEFGEISVKLGLKGDQVIQATPEFESVKAAAERTGQAFRIVYEAAAREASEIATFN